MHLHAISRCISENGNEVEIAQTVKSLESYKDGMSDTMKKVIFNCAFCFTAGTKVLTDKGEKAIELVKIGDKVLSQNEQGKQAYKPVTMLFQRTLDRAYEIRVGKETITTSDEHPFWVDKKGWVKAKDLKAGDKLKSAKGKLLKISSVRTQKSRAVVYHFTVADYHTYLSRILGFGCIIVRLMVWLRGRVMQSSITVEPLLMHSNQILLPSKANWQTKSPKC